VIRKGVQQETLLVALFTTSLGFLIYFSSHHIPLGVGFNSSSYHVSLPYHVTSEYNRMSPSK